MVPVYKQKLLIRASEGDESARAVLRQHAKTTYGATMPTFPTKPESPLAKRGSMQGSDEFDRAFANMGKALERGMKLAAFMAKYGVYVYLATALAGIGFFAFVCWAIYRLVTR